MSIVSFPNDDNGRPVHVLSPVSSEDYAFNDTVPTAAVPYLPEQVIRVHTDAECWLCLSGGFDPTEAVPLNAGTIEYFYVQTGGGASVLGKPGKSGTLTITTMV